MEEEKKNLYLEEFDLTACCPESLQRVPGNMIAFEQTTLAELPVDPEIVQQAIDGDERAFNTLFIQTYRHVFAVIRYYLIEDEDIKEVIQDTYTKAYANLHRLKAPEAFYTWLRQIAKNCALDYVERKAPPHICLGMADSVPDFLSEEAEALDTQLDITAILKELPSEQANLLVMVYYDGMSVSEIARALKLPFSTVYSRVNAAKRKLKRKLKAKGIDKPFYGGGFVAMVSNSLRHAVGTELLSITVADEIFHSVIQGKGKEDAVVAKITKGQRNQAILRVASILIAVSVVTSCLTVFFIQNGDYFSKLFSVAKLSSEAELTVDESSKAGISSAAQSVAATSRTASDNSQKVSSASKTVSSQKQTSSKVTAPVDTFVPDYLPGQQNTVGRPYNSDTLTAQGDWIYYSEGNGHCYLKKMKKDGTKVQQLTKHTQSIWDINVIGDWVYYSCSSGADVGIWRIRTDGTKREQLKKGVASNLYVVGDQGYFTESNNYGTGRMLYRINLKTKELSEVASIKENILIMMHEEMIYYIEASNSSSNSSLQTLYGCDLKTGETFLLREACGLPIPYQDKLYLISGENLVEECYYRDKKLVVNKKIELPSLPLDSTQEYAVKIFPFISSYQGGTVLSYYYRTSLNGPVSDCYHAAQTFSGKVIPWPEELNQSTWELQWYVSIGDEYVYRYTKDMRLYRVKIDGTGYQVFQ